MQRTLFLSVLLVIGLPLALCAQERKTYIGIKGGLNQSSALFRHTIDGIPRINASLTSGFNGGIVVMNFWRKHLGIQAELNYTQKGWRQKFDTGEPDFITNLDYIELPLLANLYSGKKKMHFFANLGSFFEYLVRVSQTTLPTNVGNSDFYPYDESRDNKFGYGFRGGTGMFYDFNFGTILLESNFTYSLSNMLDPVTLSTGIPDTSNNFVIGVSVAYMISFGDLK